MFNVDEKITRRFSAIFIASVLLFSSFVYKLFDFQVAQATELIEEAETKRTIGSTIYGKRGTIYDRNGLVLAESVSRFHLTVAPRHVKDYKLKGETITVATVVEKIVEITGEPYESVFSALTENPESLHEYVAKNLTLEQITAVQDLKAPWLYSETVETRVYPNRDIVANIVGFMGTDEPLAGLELMYNECLQGENGHQVYERSADGVRVPGSTIIVKPAKIGQDVHLTIDADLQWFATETLQEHGNALNADWGTIIIIDSSNGEVLTAADWPTFDANKFDTYPSDVLGSRIFTSPYEPGSTIKSISFALGLQEGIITAGEKFTIPETYRINSEHFIKDAWDHGALQYTGAGILVYSSNIGMSIMGESIGPEKIFAGYANFGFGSKTDINFIGEADGKINTPNDLDLVTKRTQLFGQGMTATGIQLAGAYQVLANDGVKLPLSIVQSCGEPEPKIINGRQIIDSGTANLVVEILEEVVEQGVLKQTVYTENYELSAKTGTAEVASNGTYGEKRIISIAGFVPHGDKNYVVITTFANPKTVRASIGAAPAYAQIVRYFINKYDIPPSEDTQKIMVKW
jgi:cell division protein FtsI (penicillin-binding protein 3)